MSGKAGSGVETRGSFTLGQCYTGQQRTKLWPTKLMNPGVETLGLTKLTVTHSCQLLHYHNYSCT